MSTDYEQHARVDLEHWRTQMLREPGLWNRITQPIQRRVNTYIPENVHAAITVVIRQMTQAVISGSNYTAAPPLQSGDLATVNSSLRPK